MNNFKKIIMTIFDLLLPLIKLGLLYVISSFVIDVISSVGYNIQMYIIINAILIILVIIKLIADLLKSKLYYLITLLFMFILDLIALAYFIPCGISVLSYFGVPSLYLTLLSVYLWIQSIMMNIIIYGVLLENYLKNDLSHERQSMMNATI
jgi:hypothetical protein